MTDHVKPASPEELEGAYSLHTAAFHQGTPDFMSFEGFKALALAKNTHLLVICRAQGGVLGYILYRLTGDEAELLSIVVEKSKQKQGLGRKLVAEMLSRLKAAGCDALFLEVSEENHAARALYRAFGATIVGLRKTYYIDPKSGKKDALIKKIGLR